MRRITGIVESGSQKAAFFTDHPWVQEQCRNKIGFSTYPGTLSLRLDSRSLAELKKTPPAGRSRLVPPEDNYCTAELQPVDIQGIPMAGSLKECRAIVNLPLIASGGIRNGVECAKALAMGAESPGE